MDEERKNSEEAYVLLDQAMCVSSRVKQQDIDKGEIDWEKVYPTTKEETQQMEDLLHQALGAAEDPHEEDFSQRYNELKEIVDWSKKRHSTWLWSLVLGALLGAGVFYYFNKDEQESTDKTKAQLAHIEAWGPSDTVISYKNCSSEFRIDDKETVSASHYKARKLTSLKYDIKAAEKSIEEYKSKLDTCKDEKRREVLQNSITSTDETIAKKHVMYDSINNMKFEDIKAMAVKEYTRRADNKQSSANSMRNYMIFLIVLIPLYIITGYPRGYTLTKHRLQSSCLTGFRKVGFGIASFCFGAGVAMALLPDDIVKTTYSSGRTETTREPNVLNIGVIAMKFGLMILGAIIFIFVSVFIMTIETALGLIRNFDWKEIFAKIKQKTEKQPVKA